MIPATDDIEDAIDRLYSLPLDEFTPARDALVKERRAAKDSDGAAAIKALRKPTAAAWALNQLSRHDTGALDDLLALGAKLRKARRAALSGRGAASLRELSVDRRAAVDALTKRAIRHLGPSGESQRDPIASSLEAALASEDASAQLRRGRIVKPLDPPSSFGGDTPGLALVQDLADDAAGQAASPRQRRRAARAERRTDGDGDRKRRELEAIVSSRLAALDKARREAQAAAREAAATRAEVSRLQDELVSANGRARAAAERARVAQWAQSQAQQELDAAGRRLDALD